MKSAVRRFDVELPHSFPMSLPEKRSPPHEFIDDTPHLSLGKLLGNAEMRAVFRVGNPFVGTFRTYHAIGATFRVEKRVDTSYSNKDRCLIPGGATGHPESTAQITHRISAYFLPRRNVSGKNACHWIVNAP
jgi:hypothetical protein